MQILINIPKDVIESAKSSPNYYPTYHFEKIWKAIANGTPQPKIGHWIFDEILDKHYYCSECKSMGVDYWDYCPYCGAKMVESHESEGK